MAHKKRERTRQQAKEKREFQKFMLIKVLLPPPLPPLSPLTSVIVFQSLAGPGYFMPAEPEMTSEPELKTPPDKRHELVVFNPGESEVRRWRIFLLTELF